MAGTKARRDLRVVLAARIGVADEERDRRAGGEPLVDAGEDLDHVVFAPLRHMARGAGLAAVEIGLDVAFGERHSRRATVDDAADRGTMRLAEVGDGEERAERVAGHR